MSNIWTFSPSSETLLKRCIDLTTPADPDNKWVKRFKKKDHDFDKTGNLNTENNKTNIIEVCDSDPETLQAENAENFDSESDDDFLSGIELEPLAKFDFIIVECLKAPETINKLARKLSVNAIEKISNHLFSKTDIDLTFLEIFYTNFIPVFLKRENCRFSLDLLVIAHKTYPNMFEKPLEIILKDLEIPNTLLNDFGQTLNEDEKLKLINNILEIELTTEQFQRNLFTIYTLYRECKKTSYLQNHMETVLFENAEYCSKDKNFGKLLLNFLQEQKNYGAFKQSSLIERAIEINRTPFKKPCSNIVKDILQNFS